VKDDKTQEEEEEEEEEEESLSMTWLKCLIRMLFT